MATNIPEYFSGCNWQIQLSPTLTILTCLSPAPGDSLVVAVSKFTRPLSSQLLLRIMSCYGGEASSGSGSYDLHF